MSWDSHHRGRTESRFPTTNRPSTGLIPANERLDRPTQFRRASERLAAVLECPDLEGEPELADAVVEAIRVRDRGYVLEPADRPSGSADGFVFRRGYSYCRT